MKGFLKTKETRTSKVILVIRERPKEMEEASNSHAHSAPNRLGTNYAEVFKGSCPVLHAHVYYS